MKTPERGSKNPSVRETWKADPAIDRLGELKQGVEAGELVLSPDDRKRLDNLLQKEEELLSEMKKSDLDGANLPPGHHGRLKANIRRTENLYKRVKSPDYSPEGPSLDVDEASDEDVENIVAGIKEEKEGEDSENSASEGKEDSEQESDREGVKREHAPFVPLASDNPEEWDSILGISKDATKKEIEAARRKLQKKYHPDHNDDHPEKENFEDASRTINEAAKMALSQGKEGQILFQPPKNEALVKREPAPLVHSKEDGALILSLPEDLPGAQEGSEKLNADLEQARNAYIEALQGLENHFGGWAIALRIPRKRKLIKALNGAAFLEAYSSIEEFEETEGPFEAWLEKEGVDERDQPIGKKVLEARFAYNRARLSSAEADIATKKSSLKENLSQEEIDAELETYQGQEIFEKYVKEEASKVHDAVKMGWPPQLRTWYEKRTDEWNSLSKTKRRAYSFAFFTAVAGMTGGIGSGAAGIGAYVGARVLGGATGVAASGALGFGWNKTIGKKQERLAQEEVELAQQELAKNLERSKDLLRSLSQADRLNEKSLQRLITNKRRRTWVKGVGGLVAAWGVRSAGDGLLEAKLNQMFGGGADVDLVDPSETMLERPETEAGDESLTSATEGEAILESAEPLVDGTIVLESGDSMWSAAKELQENLDLSDEQFWTAWGDSKVDLPSGAEVSLYDLDLVHPGDELSFDAETGLFVFEENSPGMDHGTDLPHSTSSSISEQSPAVETSTASADPEVRGYDPRQVTLTPEQAEALHPDWGLEDWKAEYERGGQVPTDFPERMMLWEPTHAMEHGMISGEVQKLTHLDSALESSEMTDAPVIERAEVLSEAASKQSGYKWVKGEDISNADLAKVEPGTRGFRTILDVTIQDRLEKIYGADLLESEDWKVRSSQSARQFMQTDPWSLPLGSHLEKMHTYLNNLKMETGIRPGVTFAIFPSNETVLEYIERAEGKKLESAIKAAGKVTSRSL